MDRIGFSDRIRRFSSRMLLATAAVAVIFVPSCAFQDKEKEQLRKEAELAKKEAELAKKEVDLAKRGNGSSGPAAIDATPSEIPTPSQTATPEAVDVTGSWSVSYKFDDGGGGTMDWKLKQQGKSLAVSTYSNVGGNSGVWVNEPNGRMSGSKITVFITEKGETVSYNGSVSGDTMSGTMSFGGSWRAKRK
ncbi:MAG: hypothetical protein IPK58_13510 [Acidobacteria bacterium]|nr:hypothetical protein [Acidobacteriota bacterium]